MQLVLLVAGLIFLLAVTAPWAATVGWICLGVFAGITAIQLLILGIAGSAVKRTHRSFDRW
jgi:hypothetical protein